MTSAVAFSLTKYSKTDLQTFESSNSCASCQLSGIEWGYTDISTINHANASISNSDLSYGEFDVPDNVDFSNATAEKTDFSHGNFGRFDASGSDLQGSNFVDSSIGSSNFNNANLENANFDGVKADGYSGSPTFVGADLTGATFSGATLKGVNFSGAKGLNDSDAAIVCGGVDADGSKQAAC